MDTTENMDSTLYPPHAFHQRTTPVSPARRNKMAWMRVVSSILALSLSIPNSQWLVYISVVAAGVFVVSFLIGIQGNSCFINWLYYTHGMGALALVLSSVVVLGDLVDLKGKPYTYATLYGIIGTSLLVVGDLFLIMEAIRVRHIKRIAVYGYWSYR